MCNVYDQLSLMTLMISDQLHGDKKGEWPWLPEDGDEQHEDDLRVHQDQHADR